jgi:hypothetical protein
MEERFKLYRYPSFQMRQWPAPINHAYILCDPLKEPDRAAYLVHWLRENDMDPAFYTMSLYCYKDTLSVKDALRVYNPWVDRKPVELRRNEFSYNLKLSEVSLVLNWAKAAEAAVEAKHDVVLFLESDVRFHERFLEDLESSMKLLKDDWDFLSLSAGGGLRPKRAEGDTALTWFKAPYYYHTRTTDAMIFKGSMLQKILKTLYPFAEVNDWELNYQLTLHSSQSYWLDPPILFQGSAKDGIYNTTL